MKILATYNIKGGVGKTAAAVNLGYLAAAQGYRVLLWDLDPQGAATYLFRIRPRVKGGGRALISGTRGLDDAVKATDYDGLDLLPADFTYRNLDLMLDGAKRPTRKLATLLAPLRTEYDVVILDCPPSISLLSESVLRAANLLLVPLIPTTLSVNTLDQLTGFLPGLKRPRPGLLAFFSMADQRKRLHREICQQLPAERADIAATVIPALSAIERMFADRVPVTAAAPRSVAARRYAELWDEVRERAGLPEPLADSPVPASAGRRHQLIRHGPPQTFRRACPQSNVPEHLITFAAARGSRHAGTLAISPATDASAAGRHGHAAADRAGHGRAGHGGGRGWPGGSAARRRGA